MITKKIKELEIELENIIENIDNCINAECTHDGWDKARDILEAKLQLLKELKSEIEKEIDKLEKKTAKKTGIGIRDVLIDGQKLKQKLIGEGK